MKRMILWVGIFTLNVFTLLWGQEAKKEWTLQDCINYAVENNIQIKQSKLTQLSGKEDLEQAKAQLFPILSGQVNQDFVNHPSDRVLTNNQYSGSYKVSANWVLYDGNKRVNAIKQEELNDQANLLDVETNVNDIRMALVRAYMQVLYATEGVTLSSQTMDVSKAQVDRARELFDAGSISRVDLAQLESQYASDQYNLVKAQNNLASYKIQLKQLLEMDLSETIEVKWPEITDTDVRYPLPEKQMIYNTALEVMPEIERASLEIDIADLDIKKAKAGYLPSISLSAGVGTGNVSGMDYSFGQQAWDKMNESISLNVSVPIYSQRKNKTAVNKAKFNSYSSSLDLLNKQKGLLKEVETVYLDASSSQNQYSAAKENLSFAEESYQLTEEQFNLGMKNTVELLTQKNNKFAAQQQMLQAKYMAVMSIELLNIYQGKEVNTNY
ncbi:MAG: TolC family protein [Massilibacteroides sp.]|nr:TolC family protein [Massilibacteroides sp.]